MEVGFSRGFLYTPVLFVFAVFLVTATYIVVRLSYKAFHVCKSRLKLGHIVCDTDDVGVRIAPSSWSPKSIGDGILYLSYSLLKPLQAARQITNVLPRFVETVDDVRDSRYFIAHVMERAIYSVLNVRPADGISHTSQYTPSTSEMLLGEFDSASFANDVDLDGTWILHGALDLGGNVSGEFDSTEVVNMFWANNNANFATC